MEFLLVNHPLDCPICDQVTTAPSTSTTTLRVTSTNSTTIPSPPLPPPTFLPTSTI